jgi:GNAT superfamily N-acetyltransferase
LPGAESELLIRPARSDEAFLVHDLVQRAYRDYVRELGGRPPPMDADYPAAIARGEVFVGIDIGLAGVIGLRPRIDHLLIDNVAVDPDRQSSGIARTLLAFAEQRALSLGLPSTRLYTHERMERNLLLYSRLGYEPQSKPADDPRPRVLLAKEL